MPRSMQDVIRRRQSDSFVGRDAPLAMFRDNLTMPSDDPRKKFLFNIHGDAGVGKTFLMKRLEQIATQQDAAHAYVDEHVYDVLEAMLRWAAQLGGSSRRFVEGYETYLKFREQIDRDPQAPGEAWSRFTQTAVKVGLHASRAVPGVAPIIDLIDGDAAGHTADQMRRFLARKFTSREIRLLLSPVSELTPLFITGLGVAAAKRPVTLFVDTYEQTGQFLDAWLLDLFTGVYGDLPDQLVVTIAGQRPLRSTGRWSELLSVVAPIPLSPFTEAEARQLLTAKGVTDERVIEIILGLSGRLPLLVATLAQAHPMDATLAGDPTGDAVERFLRWEHDTRRREAALACAMPRQINEDLVAALTSADEAPTLFAWLARQPFVTDQGGRFQYHAVVRDLMLRLLRGRSPEAWRQRHDLLAKRYADWRTTLGVVDSWPDLGWLGLRAEEEYHRFCADPSGRGIETVTVAVRAASGGVACARRWAEAIRDAGRDCGILDMQQLGDQLLGRVPAGASDCIDYLTVLVNGGRLDVAGRAEALRERGRIHGYSGKFELAVADFTVAIELAPEDPVPYVWRGHALRELRRYEEAITDLDRAITLDPQSYWALSGRGETYRRTGRLHDALADMNRVMTFAPKHEWPLGDRAQTYAALGQTAEALADYDHALAIHPDTAWLLAERGALHHVLGNATRALLDLDRAVALERGNAEVLRARALVRSTLGDRDGALQDLTQALSTAADLHNAIEQRNAIINGQKVAGHVPLWAEN
jgi:Flp pilus assembly protein TadD